MAYQLSITSGVDEGKTFVMTQKEAVIGRSPSAELILRDETVAWEHARLKDNGGRLYVENLAAVGTKVRGLRIKDETRLNHGDQIQLSDRCSVLVEQRMSYGSGKNRTTLLLLAAALVLIVIMAVGGIFALSSSDSGPPPASATHWRTAYQRLDERMQEWVEQGRFPREGLVMFRDGWRFENVGATPQAVERWDRLQSVMLSLHAPTLDGRVRNFPEVAGPDASTLSVIMGRTQPSADSTMDWNSDERYADALVWFVRMRAEQARRRAGS
mgnify:CR=1 FL=1